MNLEEDKKKRLIKYRINNSFEILKQRNLFGIEDFYNSEFENYIENNNFNNNNNENNNNNNNFNDIKF